jgi:hypothetical protein
MDAPDLHQKERGCITMKHRKIFLVFVALSILTLCACGDTASSGSPVESVQTDTIAATEPSSAEETVAPASSPESQVDNSREVYDSIMAEDHISADTAYEQLTAVETTDPEIQSLINTLAQLKSCSGHFIQTPQDTDKIYSADVEFYLSSGTIYCTPNYTNYMGELEDGVVQPTEKEDFLFKSFPQGQFYSRTQDFQIYFGVDSMYISWADTCEYTLVRGDGSAETEEATEKPFQETHLYQTLDSTLSELFENYDHDIQYDEDADRVNIAIEVPGETGALRTLLTKGDSDALEAWGNLVSSMETVGKTLYESVKIGTGPIHTDLYMVDRLHDDSVYSKNEYLLLIQDGELAYNYADDVQGTAATSGGQTSTGTSTTTKRASSGSSGTATTGERNALSKAKEYLAFMAFSYSGLIDQLEYEGFTYSEAVYGADNCGADWYEQASLKAADYLDFMAFSRDSLIEQLEYEGFTHEQAVYGAKQNGY